jgi:hypothetical protein
MAIGQELLNVPMGDMIRQMAFAIAEAQVKLDESSIKVAEMMGGLQTVYNDEGKVSFDDSRVFFGHEYMKLKDAKAYAEMDHVFTGNTALNDVVTGAEAAENARRTAGGEAAAGPDDEIRMPVRVSMLELGFTPTFYQFVDTIIEVKIAIKITRETNYGSKTSNATRLDTSSNNSSGGGIWSFFGGSSNKNSSSTVQTSQVDASYSAKYGYSAEGSSLLRTKLSPLPPPPILEERIRKLMEQDDARRQAALDAKTPA